ncbi:MAG TPA: (2Fe-2S)-binding protein [Acidimicrobiia bacterium]|jgi:carbon-monoxide dehydrogenase small subunit|nr:(2Fe-2S)-binding protein [Acidimicrobiia bacterium]
MIAVTLMVNARTRDLKVRPDSFLLEVLREELGLKGAKECCLEGECGACTVIIDGRAVNSCLVLTAEMEGAEVITVEGLDGDGLSRLQVAFLENAAAQCGFCIPGQLTAANALLESNAAPTETEIRQALAGNLCRCAGYQQIAKAVADAVEVSK